QNVRSSSFCVTGPILCPIKGKREKIAVLAIKIQNDASTDYNTRCRCIVKIKI
ncbi:hypothetical protein WN51_10962, partial [Melipona quadrifasciata]